MTANARKTAAGAPAKKRPRPRAAAKATAAKPARRVARVSEGAVGKLAVLANDPEFQRQIAEHIERGVLVQAFGNALREIFAANARSTRESAVTDEAMRAAQEFLDQVARHNGPPPTEAELDEMMRSWA